MAQRKQTKKEMKKGAKLSAKLLLWAVPVILALSIGLTFLNLPSWAIVLINLIAGGGVCFIVYVIYDKRKEKEKNEPDKEDPFA